MPQGCLGAQSGVEEKAGQAGPRMTGVPEAALGKRERSRVIAPALRDRILFSSGNRNPPKGLRAVRETGGACHWSQGMGMFEDSSVPSANRSKLVGALPLVFSLQLRTVCFPLFPGIFQRLLAAPTPMYPQKAGGRCGGHQHL